MCVPIKQFSERIRKKPSNQMKCSLMFGKFRISLGARKPGPPPLSLGGALLCYLEIDMDVMLIIQGYVNHNVHDGSVF